MRSHANHRLSISLLNLISLCFTSFVALMFLAHTFRIAVPPGKTELLIIWYSSLSLVIVFALFQLSSSKSPDYPPGLPPQQGKGQAPHFYLIGVNVQTPHVVSTNSWGRDTPMPEGDKCLSSPSENSVVTVRRRPDVRVEKPRATVWHDNKWGCQESWRPWDPGPQQVWMMGEFPRISEATAPALKWKHDGGGGRGVNVLSTVKTSQPDHTMDPANHCRLETNPNAARRQCEQKPWL